MYETFVDSEFVFQTGARILDAQSLLSQRQTKGSDVLAGTNKSNKSKKQDLEICAYSFPPPPSQSVSA
jgi:hypothetical protein